MNILILANKPPYPPKDGGAIATFNLAEGLAENGHFVYILAMNTSKHKVNINSLQKFNNLTFKYIEVNTEIKILDALINVFFSRLPYNAERFICKEYLTTLEKILHEHHFNIVQLEGPYLWYCIDLIKKKSDACISLRAHNIEFEIWKRTAEDENNFIKKFYLKNLANRIKRFEFSILNSYDYLVPITERDEKLFCSFGNIKPTCVIPVGLNIENLEENVLNNKSIFYIGALDWIPNQEGLLWFIDKVFPEIIDKHNDIVFHIAGRNAPNWLVKKFEHKNIAYHGEINNAHEFIINSGIMLVPLFSGSGMRVKIVEGLALGKTILSTSIGAEGIGISDGENIIIADDNETFCKKLIELIENSELVKLLSANARKFALENYNHIAIAKKLSDFYTKNQNLKN